MLLHTPPDKGGTPGENPSTAKARLAKHLHFRYYQFDRGNFDALVPTRKSGNFLDKRRTTAGANSVRNNPTSQADMIIEAVKAGNHGNAIALIDSNGVAPIAQDVSEQIQARLSCTNISEHARATPMLRNTDIAVMLRNVPKRSARAAYVRTYEHLQQTLGLPPALGGQRYHC